MTCDQTTLELLSRYVDGEASPQQIARAEAHLDACPECRELVKEWRRGLEMLDWAYLRSVPENVAETAFEAPTPAPDREPRWWSFALPNMRVLIAAAVLVFIALAGSFIYRTVISIPMLGRSLATAQRSQTVLVAKGIRLEIEPNSEVSRIGDKVIRLVQGTINAEVIHGRGFRIQTRRLEIIDEGTRFEVHSDPKSDRVTVKEGSVLVREGKDEFHVGAGESLTSTEIASQHIATRLEQPAGTGTPSQPHGGVPIRSIPMLLVGILLLVFWAKMLSTALRCEFENGRRKIAWVQFILLGILVTILFGQLLQAIIYYIADRRITLVLGILLWQLPWAIIYYFKVYRKDHPQERFRHLLVGRKGNERVIQWWNALVAAVISVAAFSYGIMQLTQETSIATLLVGALAGIMFVAACIVQVRSYPLDVLTDLETGERPNQEVRNKRYPLPLLVGRRNGKRVIMWGNIAMLAAFATIAYAHIASDFLGIVDHGLPRFVGAYFGFIALMVMYALLVPLTKPSKLDDDPPSQ